MGLGKTGDASEDRGPAGSRSDSDTEDLEPSSRKRERIAGNEQPKGELCGIKHGRLHESDRGDARDDTDGTSEEETGGDHHEKSGCTSDNETGKMSDAEDAPALNSYGDMIRQKIEAGELDQSIVDSLQLQRLVDGCAVPLGQDDVEEAVAIPNAEQRSHIEELMSRPARQQIKEFEGNAYIQGSEEYNIWYNKWSGERTNTVNGRATLMPAMYKCDPERDTGYTRGSSKNTLDDCGTKYCCLFFAKGCCTLGSKCNYLHRVPTVEDEFFLDSGVDIFGRERHAKHRDDMSGVGSFMTDCKSLFVGDVYPDNAEYNPVDNLKQVLTEEFGKFGRIVELNLVPAKGIAFVTYESRVIAEFAKVAMASQPLGNYSTALNVKWAHDMKKENRKKGHERAEFENRVKQHEAQLEVFQEYFLKSNFHTSGPSAAEQAQAQRAARERESQRLTKLQQILEHAEGAGEDRFDVDI